MRAQVVEDEDYRLRDEVAAGINVAKDSAVVCVRMPPAAGRKHRTSHLQTVPATVPAITELAAELMALGVQMVSMEATSVIWGRHRAIRHDGRGKFPLAGVSFAAGLSSASTLQHVTVV